MRRSRLTFPALAAAVAVAAHAPAARACGCFANPSPATPVVQAGERILFAHENDEVIAYIQIRYQGAADQFGWLVPLPSVPTLELGTDQMFSALDTVTLPQYFLSNTVQFCGGGSDTQSSGFGFGCGHADVAHGAGGGYTDQGVAAAYDMGAAGNIVVQAASLGPYDYAVLKADDETAMLQWLDDNRYFVPAGTMDAVKPYIHPGGYFLALKLRGGESAGDIAPVVLRYQSDLPMIPITLTQVGAVENMGVLVWILGEARAIPRNYYSVTLDDLPVWFSSFTNYNAQLIDAVHEAPGKHGFITQYAGTSSIMHAQLWAPGRFGDLATLRAQTTPSLYLSYLKSNGFVFDGTLLAILSKYIPEPQALVDEGVSLGQFYQSYDYYAPGMVGDVDAGVPSFDANALTDEIDMRVLQPIEAAQALIDRHPMLTRLYTALSPKDMTIDPVFSFNPDLPEVPLAHSATLTTPCRGEAWLSTDQGFEAQYMNGLPPSSLTLPAALRIDKLLDAGAPQNVVDNTQAIAAALGPVSHGSMDAPHEAGGDGGCGCSVGGVRLHANVALLLLAVGLFIARRRRRAR